MWQKFPAALFLYYKCTLEEYERRGHSNGNFSIAEFADVSFENQDMPSWLGDESLHRSHRVKLYTKLPDHYRNEGWQTEVMAMMGNQTLDERKATYVWPGGKSSWVAWRAERARLARENPASAEEKARIRVAYQSWTRCSLCKSSKHRQHNCPQQRKRFNSAFESSAQLAKIELPLEPESVSSSGHGSCGQRVDLDEEIAKSQLFPNQLLAKCTQT